MKTSDRAILIGVAMLGLAAGFYFLILAPKREEAADLQEQVSALESEVVDAEVAAAAGEEAKQGFHGNYRKLITLGKAVPVDADTPSLLTQLQTLAVDSNVDFRSITLSSAAAAGTGATTTPPATTAGAPASEASAALLPIGATVGPAGLPVMPYEMTFAGGFFDIADFFGRVDGMVDSHGERTSVHGRLLTIDGFNLTPGPKGLPALTANVTATSYLTPADQGVTAGATASGPTTVTETAAATPPADPTATDPAAAAVVSN
jgi:hypothetical protein